MITNYQATVAELQQRWLDAQKLQLEAYENMLASSQKLFEAQARSFEMTQELIAAQMSMMDGWTK